MMICRNANERVLIESSINSVRVSIAIKQVTRSDLQCLNIGRWDWKDPCEEIHAVPDDACWEFLCSATKAHRGFEYLLSLTKKGYDVSFLITNFHTESMFKHKLVDFVIQVSPQYSYFLSSLHFIFVTHLSSFFHRFGCFSKLLVPNLLLISVSLTSHFTIVRTIIPTISFECLHAVHGGYRQGDQRDEVNGERARSYFCPTVSWLRKLCYCLSDTRSFNVWRIF